MNKVIFFHRGVRLRVKTDNPFPFSSFYIKKGDIAERLDKTAFRFKNATQVCFDIEKQEEILELLCIPSRKCKVCPERFRCL